MGGQRVPPANAPLGPVQRVRSSEGAGLGPVGHHSMLHTDTRTTDFSSIRYKVHSQSLGHALDEARSSLGHAHGATRHAHSSRLARPRARSPVTRRSAVAPPPPIFARCASDARRDRCCMLRCVKFGSNLIDFMRRSIFYRHPGQFFFVGANNTHTHPSSGTKFSASRRIPNFVVT